MKKIESRTNISSRDEIKNLFKEENLIKNQDNQSLKREKEKIAFLDLLNTKFAGVGMEDYQEYNFEDIGKFQKRYITFHL